MGTITYAVTEGLQGAADNIISLIGTALPIALPIMGCVLAVGVGIGIFKRFVL